MPAPRKPRNIKPNAQGSRSAQRKIETVRTEYTQARKQAQRSGPKAELDRRISKAKKDEIKSTKTLEKQWKAYVKQLEQTNIKIPEMEALRPFMGSRGGVLKRQTRSKKQKEAFKQAAAGVKGVLGRKTSAEAIKAAQKKAKLEKQKSTAGRNAATKDAQRQHKKKPEEGKPLTKRAQKVAKEAEEKYSRMVDILDKGSRDLLSAKVRYEIYKVLDEEEVSDEDISEFIDKLLETLDDIPEEAKELNQQDDFYEVLLKIRNMGITDLEDMKTMFIALADHSEDHESVLESIDYWQEHNNGMGFRQFYEELEQYNDMWEPENWAEILGTEEET